MSPGTLSYPETCVHVCIETCIKNILVYIYKRIFFISVDIIFKNMLKPYFGCFFHTREYIKSQVNLVWRSETQCNKIVRWFKPEIRQHHLEKCGTDTLLNGIEISGNDYNLHVCRKESGEMRTHF